MDNEVKINLKGVCDGHHKATYRGVKSIKCPFDYLIYQMIINSVKPDLIIEIGTSIGGGALYLADLLEIIGKGEVHTIDKNPMPTSDIFRNHKRIKFFTGGYQSYDISNTKGFNKILVIDDGSHTYEDVKNTLIKFGDIVTKGSYFIVEDGIIDELLSTKYMTSGYHNGGPLRAIGEYMDIEGSNKYVIDRYWCDFFGKNATFNVNGYLKKI